MSRTATVHRLVARTTVLLIATSGFLLTSTAVQAAAPDAPGSLVVQQPDGATPMLSWGSVSGAAKYEIQVDNDPGFGSPYGSTVVTVNTTHVPTVALADGPNHWRVRAVNGASERSPWATGSFDSPRLAAPIPASPVDGAVLEQPGTPPVLVWSAAAGAESYVVEVSGDDDFVVATTHTTKATSFVVPDALATGDWFWRVTASQSGGYSSLPSQASRFVIDPVDVPQGVSPLDNPAVQDVVLDWEPMPGAKTYDVQIATNEAFTQGMTLATGVTGTTFSPLEGLDNADYWWRVRAVDADGHATPWPADPYRFDRTYPQVPELLHPAAPGNEEVGAPAYFQWEPVAHASEYELWVGTDPNFSPDTYASCRTAGTTYTPGMFSVNTTQGSISDNRRNEDCEPAPGAVNYWRVRALDRPFTKPGAAVPGIQGAISQTEAFLYQPLSITDMSPRLGEVVDVPVLRWDPVVGAETYRVAVLDATGQVVDDATTSATTYTPAGDMPLLPSGNPYTWQVRAVDAQGGSSVNYRNVFSVSGETPSDAAAPLTPLSPTPTTTGIRSAPQLTWAPMPEAAFYAVRVGQAMDGQQIWFGHTPADLFEQPMAYPTMTDTSKRLLTPGDYDWRAYAYDSSGALLAAGPESRFTVEPIRSVTGHSVALSGAELTDASGSPCTTSSGDCTVPATPTLGWDADPRASFYMVYMSRDPLFTNLLEPDSAVPATTNSLYAPALDNREHTYDDREAGNAYYWHVRPCRAQNICAPNPVSSPMAEHSFKKRSPQPRGLSSSDPAGTEITFRWNDYLDDNRSSAWSQTLEEPFQAAMQYRVQVDNDISFGSPLVDEELVDQPTYTAAKRLYPEGTYFWRVQAVDSNDNGLTWSTVQTFTKQSPTVTPIAPVQGQAATSPLFRWAAQAFAVSYDVEVYKNNDATHSVANRVLSKTGVKTTAFAAPAPLQASATPYVWRVRRTDAVGNKGPWSPDAAFRVADEVPTITSPADGGSQPTTAPVVTWAPVAGATTYTVTLRSTSSGSVTESATTPARAFAATRAFPTGTYTASVAAKDTAGQVIGTSSVTFSVNSALTATRATAIAAPSGTGVGQTLTSTPPAWNQPDVSEVHQWLRDGLRISGATGATYTLTAADLNKGISLRVTATRTNFDDGESTSNVIGGSAGGALQATTQPSITGSPVVGTTLKASPGVWSQSSPSFAYQWLRTGAPIPNATGQGYKLTPEDAGKDVSVVVLASKVAYADGSASASAVTVARMSSTTTASLAKTRVKPGQRVKVGISVTVPGVLGPVGAVKVFDGAKALKTLTLVSARNGKLGWKLPKLKKGKHKIKVVYLGNSATAGSKSKVTKLYVVR